ncbi:unnamed protein product [Linum tenue]|uniref:Uncharacterized protein n=1 Tax=Linum tenue TaxID=586396 RepID=A0AAV0S3J1_9ROSI|nr:unnamed protein product [Linum tenue]
MCKRSSGQVLRSLSPRGRFPSYNSAAHLSSSSSSSAFASSTSSSFYSPSSAFFRTTAPPHRSASPTRVNVYPQSPSSPTFRFSIDRSTSPNRSISVTTKHTNHISSLPRGRRVCALRPRIPDRFVAVSTRTAPRTATPEGARSLARQ